MRILEWILAVMVVAFIGYMGVTSVKDGNRSNLNAQPKAQQPQVEEISAKE